MKPSSVRSVSSIGVSGSNAWSWYRSTASTPSRRSDASSARVRCRADSPLLFGASSSPEPAFGGQHDGIGHARRAASQPAADDLLRPPVAVDVRGVDQRAARVGKAVQLPVRDRFVRLLAEGHGAEAEARHRTAAASQSAIFHASATYAAKISAALVPSRTVIALLLRCGRLGSLAELLGGLLTGLLGRLELRLHDLKIVITLVEIMLGGAYRLAVLLQAGPQLLLGLRGLIQGVLGAIERFGRWRRGRPRWRAGPRPGRPAVCGWAGP